jgi:hypothetical protein
MKKYTEILKEVEDLKSKVSLKEFTIGEVHDSGNRDVIGIEDEDFVLFVQVAIPFQGELLEDHRVLNVLASDYVADKFKELNAAVNKPILAFLTREYQDVADYTEVLNGVEDLLWEEQVDYIPLVDKSGSTLFITLEIMLAMEPTQT